MTFNFALATIAGTAPGTSGTTFTVSLVGGSQFVAGKAAVVKASVAGYPDPTTAEVVTLPAPSGSTFTGVARASEGPGVAINIAVGDFLVQAITADEWDAVKALAGTVAGVAVSGTAAAGRAPVASSGSAAAWTDVATQAELDALAAALPGMYAPLAEPVAVALAGTLGNSSTRNVGTTAGTVAAGDDSRITGAAPLASPAFTGNPTAPTPTPGDNDTSIATTAFVTAAVAAGGGAVSSVVGQTGAVTGTQIVADSTVAAALAARTPLVRATTVAFASTVTPNADTTDVLNVGALTGPLTLAAPTGTPRDGQTLRVRFLQDGTGSRAITFNAAYAFGTDVTTALMPTAANSKWEMAFQWHATDSKWRATAIVRGF